MKLTQQRLKELLNYDPKTGDLIWRPRAESEFSSPRYCKTWNKRFAGKRAGWISSARGYKRIYLSIGNRTYPTGRVIWIWMTGEIPNIIDHKDGDATNNRFDNLRNTDVKGNGSNCKLYSTNTSGFSGVSFHKHRKKFYAQIYYFSKNIYLGSFDTVEEAIQARKSAAQKYGYTERHGTPPHSNTHATEKTG
jgi:hypothetical protein